MVRKASIWRTVSWFNRSRRKSALKRFCCKREVDQTGQRETIPSDRRACLACKTLILNQNEAIPHIRRAGGT